MVTYDFNISTSIQSGVVDTGRLAYEIRSSSITIALDDIATIGDNLKITFKADLTGSEPQTLTDILSAHTGEPMTEVQTMITKQEYPRGYGFRKRTPEMFSYEFMAAKWEFTCAEGKQILFRKNKVIFNNKIQNVPAIIFEIDKKIGDDLFTVYQNRYNTFMDLCTDSDLFFCYPQPDSTHGSIIRLEFKWPNYSSVDRLPQFMNAGDVCRIYFTNDTEHVGVGTDPTNVYYVHPVYGCVVYNNYTLALSGPTWPVDFPEELKIAQVCVHCVSHNEGELV